MKRKVYNELVKWKEESKGKTKIEVAGREQSGETIYAKINLRKIPKKQGKSEHNKNTENKEKIIYIN